MLSDACELAFYTNVKIPSTKILHRHIPILDRHVQLSLHLYIYTFTFIHLLIEKFTNLTSKLLCLKIIQLGIKRT